jgi:hypothetical protein
VVQWAKNPYLDTDVLKRLIYSISERSRILGPIKSTDEAVFT